MSKLLHISDGTAWPTSAVTQTFAILAKKGAGKSNTAVVLAEEFYDADIPWVCLDGKGDWWGVRAGHNGKSPGLSVPIIGGEHADLPLEAGAGQFLADLIASKRLTAVIDLSLFSKGELLRFCADFADRLYRVNREPLHLFCEEADQYVPQRVMHEEARCVGAFSKLVRLGRTHGLGVTLITQRSAVLNKDVLTQIDTLIAMRTTSPQDRDAIGRWVEEHETGADLIETLPSLNDGEGWVWSPHWLGELERVTFRRRRTYDSGATPEMGKSKPVARLADIDLGAIRGAMEKTILAAKENDPKELRKRITELLKQLHDRPTTAVEKIVEVPVLKNGQFDRTEKIIARVEEQGNKLLAEAAELRRMIVLASARALPSAAQATTPKLAPQSARAKQPFPRADMTIRKICEACGTYDGTPHQEGCPHGRRQSAQPQHPRTEGDAQLTKVQQRILDALAWYESLGNSSPSLTQVGAVALIDPTGGYFSNSVGPLSSGGLVTRGNGMMSLTDAGRALAAVPESVGTLADYHEVLRQRVRRMRSANGKTIEILNVIIANG